MEELDIYVMTESECKVNYIIKPTFNRNEMSLKSHKLFPNFYFPDHYNTIFSNVFYSQL